MAGNLSQMLRCQRWNFLVTSEFCFLILIPLRIHIGLPAFLWSFLPRIFELLHGRFSWVGHLASWICPSGHIGLRCVPHGWH